MSLERNLPRGLAAFVVLGLLIGLMAIPDSVRGNDINSADGTGAEILEIAKNSPPSAIAVSSEIEQQGKALQSGRLQSKNLAGVVRSIEPIASQSSAMREFSKPLSFSQLRRAVEIQGPEQTRQLLARIGIDRSIRQRVCGMGSQDEMIAAAFVLSERASQATSKDLRRLHGESENDLGLSQGAEEITRATLRALAVGCLYQVLEETGAAAL